MDNSESRIGILFSIPSWVKQSVRTTSYSSKAVEAFGGKVLLARIKGEVVSAISIDVY